MGLADSCLKLLYCTLPSGEEGSLQAFPLMVGDEDWAAAAFMASQSSVFMREEPIFLRKNPKNQGKKQ